MGSDGLRWTRRKPQYAIQDYHVQSTFNHGGGSLMFWGCMTWNGVGQACKIEGTLDSTLYCEIIVLLMYCIIFKWTVIIS